MIGNGLGSGQRFFDTGSEVLLNNEDGAICEGFIRIDTAPIGLVPSETDWKMNVDMLVLAGSKGKRVITITKTWTRATPAQIDAMHEFTLASFLPGNDGRSSYSFLATPASLSITPDPWSGFPIGVPIGTYAKINGVYQRSFTTGKVLGDKPNRQPGHRVARRDLLRHQRTVIDLSHTCPRNRPHRSLVTMRSPSVQPDMWRDREEPHVP